MKEVTKDKFKEIYFKLGGGTATGWSLDYWDKFFEGEQNSGMKYLLEEPETPEQTRMMIATDFGLNEHRLFFLTEESEESFFEFPDQSRDKAQQNKSLQPMDTAQPDGSPEITSRQSKELPCCGTVARYVTELPHVYQFDFDLYQCGQCARYWVRAWRQGIGGWEETTTEDAEKMQLLGNDELRAFMKKWAQSFN